MTQTELQPLPEVAYPPAPWTMLGHMWAGMFELDRPMALPNGLCHGLSTRSLLVVLVRYVEGTLRYDELVLGALARRGARLGIYLDAIWVDSLASVWGGRRIWGLPKNMASFEWQGSQVHVAASARLVQLCRQPLSHARARACRSCNTF